MADFLRNLVAKNLNLAPVLEPRPLSLYEPWQQPGAREFPSRSDEARLEVSLPREATAPSPRPRPHEPLESPHPQSSLRAPKVELDVSPIRVQRSETLAVEPRVVPPQAVPPRIPESPSVGEANTRRAELEIDRSLASLRPRAERAPSTETLRVERVIVEPERANAFSNLVARDQVAREPALTEPPMTPVSERVSSKREAVERDSHAAAPPTLVPRPLSRLTQTMGAEPAPETINVTIGRIEVRAVTSQPVLKTPRPPQLSTLEDYLRGSSKR